ncbi:MAG: type VI secretion system tip protein TssI/VgrG [Enhygromyxa sp.]
MTPPDDPRDEHTPARLQPVLFDLWLPRGPDLSWQVLSLRGTEALSRPYEFEVELWTDDPDADFEQVLGADCELMLERNGHERRIYGLIAEVEVLLAAQLRIARDGIGVRVKVVPAFRLLEHELDTRFFSGRTVIEILDELLGSRLAAYERTLELEACLAGEYERRDYCVQFRESTFDFCSRLMQEEGIAYLFVPDDEAQRERMVLVDNNEAYAAAELLVPEPIAIELDRPDQLDRESLQALSWRQQPAVNRVLTRGYNYKLSAPFDEGEAEELGGPRPVVREQAHEGVRRQIIDDPHDDPDATRFDGSGLAQQVPLARRLLEARRVEAALGRGRGNVIGFAAGTTFELDQPLIGGPSTRRFLLTRVVHSGGVTESPGATEHAYENHFECIAAEQVFRPKQEIKKPRVHGVQTGVVIGKTPDEVHTDSLGRVRVAFHQHHHSQDEEHSSCWIRVAQIWAGPGYGAMVIPRVGMEVVVAFVDGDPDQPLVTGCVYNGKNLPPYELPEQLSKSTFKTSSTPGGDGFGELRFEDAEGSEQLFVKAQRRMDLRVQGTLFSTCTGDREEVVGSLSESEGEGLGSYNLHVFGEVNTQVDRGNRIIWCGQETHMTGADRFEMYHSRRMIWSDLLYQVGAPNIITEASETISESANVIVLAGSDTVSLQGGDKIVLESNNAIDLRVGNNFISISHSGIDINGSTLRLNSGGGAGHAVKAVEAEFFETLIPFEASPADDGRSKGKGTGKGRRRARQRRSWKAVPHRPPPMTPPKPPKPGGVEGSSDASGVWQSMAWKQAEAWCSESVSLLFEVDRPSSKECETAFIQDATDGEAVLGVGVTAQHGSFEHAVEFRDILPRNLPVGVEESRELNAKLSNGLPSTNSTVLRFITNLPRMEYREGRSRFAVEIVNHEVVISSRISYIRGQMGMLISLGDLAAEGAGGVFGKRLDGYDDWRYCKKVTVGGDPNRLAYWDGAGWRIVPKEFKDYNSLGDKLLGIALWKEKFPWKKEPVVKDQYGGKFSWPDDVPEWAPESVAKLNEKVLKRWSRAIADMWSNKFDFEREQCRGYDPQCCRYSVTCKVDFYEVDERSKAEIVISENYARANASAWPLRISNRTAAHEFGHHLGNPDEYPGASSLDIWVNDDGAVLGMDKKSIMGSGSVVRRRHFDTVADALARLVKQGTGKSYTYSAVRAGA